MRHKLVVLVVLLVWVGPLWAHDCLCNFAAGGPTAVDGPTDPRAYPRVTGSTENTKLEAVEQRVRSNQGFADFPGSFQIVDMPGRNGFMFPTGEGYFTREMVANYSEDELAGVMGHEMLHYYKQHGQRRVNRTQGWLRAMDLALMTTGGNLERNLFYGLLAGLFLDSGRQSRGQEYEADRGGVVIATQAGYDSVGLALLMDDFSQRYRPSRNAIVQALGVITYPLSSHPPSGKRANEIRKFATDPKLVELRNARLNSQPAGLATSGVDSRQITLFVEQINIEGYGYSSPEHLRQLILTELRNYVRVFEQQTPEVRYKAVLSANIAIGWSGGNRGVSLPEFDIQVSSGRSRAHGEFSGTVVDLQSAEVVGGTTSTNSGTSKTNASFTVHAGRMNPVSIQTFDAGNMEQILLQRLVSEGVKSWVASLVKTVEVRPEATQPAGLPTAGVERLSFPIPPGSYARVGEIWTIVAAAGQAYPVTVIEVIGDQAYYAFNGRRPPGGTYQIFPPE